MKIDLCHFLLPQTSCCDGMLTLCITLCAISQVYKELLTCKFSICMSLLNIVNSRKFILPNLPAQKGHSEVLATNGNKVASQTHAQPRTHKSWKLVISSKAELNNIAYGENCELAIR